jgi:hypothetical protein
VLGECFVLRRRLLKPSSIVAISFRVTVYEAYVLKLLSMKCGLTRSTLVRIALLKLIRDLMGNGMVKGELPPGYDSMLEQLCSEYEELLSKCINKLR